MFTQDRAGAMRFWWRNTKVPALTARHGSDCIIAMKWPAIIALMLLQCSCTTLVNRRDLYSPEPDPSAMPPVTKTTTTTTTTHIEHEEAPVPAPAYR
jgi:hypothetical protein